MPEIDARLIGDIALILGILVLGGKRFLLKILLNILIDAIEHHGNKDLKNNVQSLTSLTNTDELLNEILKKKNYLKQTNKEPHASN